MSESVEMQFYQLENGILTYLSQNFTSLHGDKSPEEQKKLLSNWYHFLDESTKGEQYSDWLLQKTSLESFGEVCQHILECRIDETVLREPIPESHDIKKILDVYARYYVNISLTAQFLSDSLCDFDSV